MQGPATIFTFRGVNSQQLVHPQTVWLKLTPISSGDSRATFSIKPYVRKDLNIGIDIIDVTKLEQQYPYIEPFKLSKYSYADIEMILGQEAFHFIVPLECFETAHQDIPVSSRRVSRSRGGGERSLCIQMSYSEQTRAESREGTSTRVESWRSTRFWLADDSGDVILDSDWLTKLKGFFVLNSEWLTKYQGSSCSILTGCWHSFGFGHKPGVFGEVLRWVVGRLTHFRHWEIFREIFFEIFPGAPARILITARTIY